MVLRLSTLARPPPFRVVHEAAPQGVSPEGAWLGKGVVKALQLVHHHATTIPVLQLEVTVQEDLFPFLLLLLQIHPS